MTLELQAINAWRAWAVYQQHGLCAGCGVFRYVGRNSSRSRWLCVGCWDQKP